MLLAQRPGGGRWAGLWEFPHGALLDGEVHEDAAGRLVRDLTGLHARPGPELLTIRHGITRYHITMTCFEAAYLAGDFRSDFYVEGRWLAAADLAAYPVSSPQRRLARFLLSPSRQRCLFGSTLTADGRDGSMREG